MYYNIFAIGENPKTAKFIINKYESESGPSGSKENYIRDAINAKHEGKIINSLISSFHDTESEAILKLKNKIK